MSKNKKPVCEACFGMGHVVLERRPLETGGWLTRLSERLCDVCAGRGHLAARVLSKKNSVHVERVDSLGKLAI